MNLRRSAAFLLLLGSSRSVRAAPADSTRTGPVQEDLVDALKSWIPRLPLKAHDSGKLQSGGHFLWLLPNAGYTLQTKFLVQVIGNLAYRRPGAYLSTVQAAATYTQNAQSYYTLTPALWTRNNTWYLTGDYRYMEYPQATYGLGMYTNTDRVVSMDYNYLRVYQSVLRKVAPSFWLGAGYRLDAHWDISSWTSKREVARISAYRYGVQGTSVSSGPVAHAHYDTRTNPINPQGGALVDAVYRISAPVFGADRPWDALQLDARTYLPLDARKRHVLALWSYDVFTLGGEPPFLDLPSTGWDTYSATGRGFIQGRFRGRSMMYGEAEGRFTLTRNGLLGGVLFTNVTSVTEPSDNRFVKWVPAAGFGLRVNLNKVSRTNLAVDYGFGADGSRGLFFNLGEVF